MLEITKKNKVLGKKLETAKKSALESIKALDKINNEVSQLQDKIRVDKKARKDMELDLGKESQRIEDAKRKTIETQKLREVAISESKVAEKLRKDREVKYQAEVKPRVEAERKLKEEESISHKLTVDLKKTELEIKNLENKIKTNVEQRAVVETKLKREQNKTENLHKENDEGRIKIDELFEQSGRDKEILEEINSKLEEGKLKHEEAEKIAISVLQRREELEKKLKSYKDATAKMTIAADKEEKLAKEAEEKEWNAIERKIEKGSF